MALRSQGRPSGRAMRACLLGALLSGLAVMSPGAALAAEPRELGFLVVEPARGDLTSAIDIATSGICTRGQMFAVKLDGPNLEGADRGNVIGTTKIVTIGPDSYPGHYVVPLPTDLATYLAANAPGQRIKGDYTLTFACRDRLSADDLEIFTATISIDGKGRYVAQGDAATPIDKLTDGYVPGSAGLAYGDPAAPDPEAVAEFTETEAAAAETVAQETPWRMLLTVVGALLLLGAAYAYWRGRDKSGTDPQQRDDESVGVGS